MELTFQSGEVGLGRLELVGNFRNGAQGPALHRG